MISYTAIQVSDTYMVSVLGEEAIAATGIGGLVYFTVLSFLMNGSVGIQILTSRRLGEKRDSALGKILGTILVSGLVIGILISFIGSYFSENLILLISENESITPNATKYLSIRFLGTVFLVLLYVLRGFFDGLGQTFIGMIAAFVTMFSNIFLNWIFIYGNLGISPMGVEGAAIASSLAGGLGFLVFFCF